MNTMHARGLLSELIDAADRYLDWNTMSVDDYKAKYPDTLGNLRTEDGDTAEDLLRSAIAKAKGGAQ